MRSRRHSLSAIIKPNATSKTATSKKTTRTLTPPRNKMPMAITAITMKAPMSGSASSNTPTSATATPIGATARRKLSLTSILRTM